MANLIASTMRKAYESGDIKPRKKCCGKCAFRKGSPERADPWAWMQLVESWRESGNPFFCHEGVPGHPQQVEGEELRVCGGFHATKAVPDEKVYDLAEFS